MVLSKYLNKEEALSLKDKLAEAGIDSTLREHGPSRFLWGGIFCLIQVAGKDYDKAAIISDAFNKDLKEKRDARNRLLTSECPECKSMQIATQEKKSLFAKLIYLGVTRLKCGHCGHEWFT